MPQLAFSSCHEFLGEFFFEQGVYRHASLSRIGEELLQAELTDWQVRGIPIRETLTTDNESQLIQRRILLTSGEAEWAFTCWASDHAFIAFALPARLLPYWEKLSRLDLESNDRFTVIHTLLTANHEQLQAWEKGMDKLLTQGS